MGHGVPEIDSSLTVEENQSLIDHLIQILTNENIDDRPSSDLLLFHPYFTMINKSAQNRLIK